MFVSGSMPFAAMAVVCVVAFFKQRRRRQDEATSDQGLVVE
jgi:hypothetical protein